MGFMTLRDDLLQYNHSWTFWTLIKSSFISFANVCKLFPVKNIFVSPANNIDIQASDTVDKSLIYIKNNRGPNMDPCGTPQLIFSVLDFYAIICYILFPVCSFQTMEE